MAKQSWRMTGLWAKKLPSGGTLLSSKVPVTVLQDAIDGAKAAGLSHVVVEVWETDNHGADKPSHSLRIAEPFQPQNSQPASRDAGEAFPF